MALIASYPTGSRFICDPPVENTDEDCLLLVDDMPAAVRSMLDVGYEQCLFNKDDVEPGVNETWTAVRRGEINFVITTDKVLYLRAVGATLLAREMNITDKVERVRLFRSMKFGRPYEGKVPDYYANKPTDEPFGYDRG